MSAAARDSGGKQFGVNLTPMIDVVFLLIIFFMLVAELSRARSLDLEPPRISGLENVAPDAPLVQLDTQSDPVRVLAPSGWFELDATGAIKLAESLAGTDEVRLLAARDAPFDRVRPAMRVLRDAGIQRVDLVVGGTAP